tara:strand:+ start:87836 stop:88903 length:1068 start_codon:yes stop_codon:yes gene_type:complete
MNKKWQEYLKSIGNYDTKQNTITFYPTERATEALEQELTIIPLTQLAFIKVSGVDAQDFLNGQLTCNLSELTSAFYIFGAHCSAKGKIQNFYRICHYPNDPSAYLLILQKETLADSLKLLAKYALFSDVKIEDATQDLSAVCLHGPKLPDFFKETFELKYDVKSINTVLPAAGAGSILQLRGNTPRALFIAPSDNVIQLCETKLKKFVKLNSTVWELLEIRAGIPIIYPELTNTFFPHYLNLPSIDAVSFNKGCYIGQEVITRMQFRGKSNKHMHRAFIVKNEPGTLARTLVGKDIISVQDQNRITVGTVIVCSQTNKEQFELLAVIHNQYENFINLFVNSAEEPKLYHLDLTCG